MCSCLFSFWKCMYSGLEITPDLVIYINGSAGNSADCLFGDFNL